MNDAALTRLGRKLDRWAEENSVDTMVCLIRDPDSCDAVTVRRGDRIWRVGALHVLLQEETDNWVDVKPKDGS